VNGVWDVDVDGPNCPGYNASASLAEVLQSAAWAGVGAFLPPDEVADVGSAAPHVAAVIAAEEKDVQLHYKLTASLRQASYVSASLAGTRLLTFQGGGTNREAGIYAGQADVQGVDAYIGACAPTMVSALSPLVPWYSWAYGRNTRNNAMPLSTLVYAQDWWPQWSGLASQATLALEASLAYASGSKGLITFAVCRADIGQWGAGILGSVLRAWAAVSHIVATGDVGGLGPEAVADNQLAVVVRNHEAMVLAVHNLRGSGYHNWACAHIDGKQKWKWAGGSSGDLVFALSTDVANPVTATATEVVNGQFVPLTGGAGLRVDGENLVLSGVEFGDGEVVRLFVLEYELRG
jgi:hypothetical protein